MTRTRRVLVDNAGRVLVDGGKWATTACKPKCCAPPDPDVVYRRARMCPGECLPPGELSVYVPEGARCPGSPVPMGDGQVFLWNGLCWKLEAGAGDPRFKPCPPAQAGFVCLPPGAAIVLESQIVSCYSDCATCPGQVLYFQALPCQSNTYPHCVMVRCDALLAAMIEHGACVVFRFTHAEWGTACLHVSLASPWTTNPGPGCAIVHAVPGPVFAGKCCECVGPDDCCYAADQFTPPDDLGPPWDLRCCHWSHAQPVRDISFRYTEDFRPTGAGGQFLYTLVEGAGTLVAPGETIEYREWRGPDPDNLTLVNTVQHVNPGPCCTPAQLWRLFGCAVIPQLVLFQSAGPGETLVREGEVRATCDELVIRFSQYILAPNGTQSTPTMTFDTTIRQTAIKGPCPPNCIGLAGPLPLVPPGGVGGLIGALAKLGVTP